MGIRRVLKNDALWGDRLMQIPGLRAMKRIHPEDEVVLWVPRKDPNPQVTGSEVFLRGLPYIDAVEIGSEFDLRPDDQLCDLDTLAAYHWCVKHGKQLSQGIAHLYGVEVADDDLLYDYQFLPGELEEGRALAAEIGQGKPIVAIARHSASCSWNDPNVGWPNKMLQPSVQVEVAQWLDAQGYLPVALGSKKEERDVRFRVWPWPKLYGKPPRLVAAFLAHCHAAHTVDTGIRHLAAAVGTNFHCISGTIPIHQISCRPTRPGQRVVDYYRPLQDAPASYLIAQLQKVL